AIAIVLLTAAGVLERSVSRLRAVPSGLDPDRVLAVDLSIFPGELGVPPRQVLERVAALPGAERAGQVDLLPLRDIDGCTAVFLDDRPANPSQEPACVPIISASPGALQVLGIRVEGEDLSWGDAATGRHTAVVTRAL